MAQEPKVDRRVRRTRRLLREALISLVLEKDLEDITIKEITERADVAYVTFFRHYDAVGELLMEVLEEQFRELRIRVETAARDAQDGERNIVEGTLIFEHVRDNSGLYQILLNSESATLTRRRVKDTIAALFDRTCQPLHEGTGLIPGELAADHIATALLGLIRWWLDKDMLEATGRMGEIYNRLIVTATLNAVADVTQ